MTGRWRFLDQLNITTRLVFWFFVIALVPVIALTLITHFLSVRSLELTVRRQLTSVLDAKAEKLEDLIRERRNNALLLGQIPKVTEALVELDERPREERSEYVQRISRGPGPIDRSSRRSPRRWVSQTSISSTHRGGYSFG